MPFIHSFIKNRRILRLGNVLIFPVMKMFAFLFMFQIQVPFNTYFKVEPLTKFHRVVLMHEFMEEFSDTVWPPEARIGESLRISWG